MNDTTSSAFMQATRMAERVRAAYIRAMNAFVKAGKQETRNYLPGPWWDGGLCRTPKGKVWRSPIWPKLARFFLDQGIAPETYITVIFMTLHLREDPPRPNQLSSDRYLQRYQQYVGSGRLEDDIRLEFRSQQLLVRVTVLKYRDMYKNESREVVQKLTLLSPERIAPLTRYCLAHREGFLDIAEKFFPEAVTQYITAPDAYDKVWKDWLPEGFRHKAEAHYRSLCRALHAITLPPRPAKKSRI